MSSRPFLQNVKILVYFIMWPEPFLIGLLSRRRGFITVFFPSSCHCTAPVRRSDGCYLEIMRLGQVLLSFREHWFTKEIMSWLLDGTCILYCPNERVCDSAGCQAAQASEPTWQDAVHSHRLCFRRALFITTPDLSVWFHAAVSLICLLVL